MEFILENLYIDKIGDYAFSVFAMCPDHEAVDKEGKPEPGQVSDAAKTPCEWLHVLSTR
jgi:hypothetical protein